MKTSTKLSYEEVKFRRVCRWDLSSAFNLRECNKRPEHLFYQGVDRTQKFPLVAGLEALDTPLYVICPQHE